MAVAQEYVNGVKTLALSTDGQQVAAAAGRSQTSWKSAVQAAFLPVGYPESVTPDYLGFQIWDTVQALSSYIRGMLSSQAILVGVGVGKEAATPLGAVFQFFVRDLTGMLGGILFATYQGTGLDSYAKQWRIFADCLNDAGMAIELASPLFPSAFLLLACLGSIARAVTGVAGGATRAALTQHFARQRNAADIAAKEGSQETATTMVGMILGLALTHLTVGRQAAAWLAFLLLTWLHIFANVRALRCLQMTSINRPRLDLLLRHYLSQGKVLSPSDMAGRETLLAPPLQRLVRLLGWPSPSHQQPINIAPHLSSLGTPAQRQLALLLGSPAAQASRQRYLVAQPGPGQAPIVLLRPGATAKDILLAYCTAQLAALPQQLSKGGAQAEQAAAAAAGGARKRAGSGGSSGGDAWRALSPTAEEQQRLEAFVGGLAAAGWACERVALLQGDSRVEWGPGMHQE